MSTPDEKIKCPACHETFRTRDLQAEHFVVQKCRSCGYEIGRTSHWASGQDEQATILEDVTAIGNWLDAVALESHLKVEAVRDRESFGEFLWSITGLPYPWRCEATYERRLQGVVVVRLCSDAAAPDALPDKGGLTAACASQCVQPQGERSGHSWWGAGQALLTGNLPPSIFGPVVGRLDAVLRTVTPPIPQH
jgi:hypothetical protein